MEEGKEEQWDDDDIIAEYGAFNDTAMGEAEEEVGQRRSPLKKRWGQRRSKFMFDGGIMSRSNDVKTNFQSKHKSFSEFN